MKTTRSRKTGKATGRKVAKRSENGRQQVRRTEPTPPPKGAKGYKNHVKGSRKETVHKVFDEKGGEEAKKKGLDLGLKPGTLVTWFGTWRRADAANGTGKTKTKVKAGSSENAAATVNA